MPIQFDPVAKYILITSPTTTLTALQIYSGAMDWCDTQENMGYTVPIEAVGKFDMGGGVYSDSIFMLKNGWKIKFWSGTYQAVITGTLLGEPGESRTVPPDSGNVEVIFQVSSQATVIPDIAEWTQTEKDTIQAKTDNIPPDLSNVPTDTELDAKHGSGSWEGATPTQVWNHEERKLTSRAVAGGGESIAAEATLDDMKGTPFQPDVDSLKKIRELVEELQTLKIAAKARATV